MIIFHRVEPWNIEPFWSLIEPFALQMEKREPDTWPAYIIKRHAAASNIDLWLIWAEEPKHLYGILATRIVEKASGKRWMTVPFAAGHRHKRWTAPAAAHVEELGRLNGCARVQSFAREGWSRSAPGYRKTAAVFEKEL